jgi:general secretion pathway protein A
LDPLTLRDTVDYILLRLGLAGMPNQTVFSEALMSEIHLRSQGIPRLINAICDNLLLTAFAMDRKACDLEMLDEVCCDMRLDWPGRRARRPLAEEAFEQTPYKI